MLVFLYKRKQELGDTMLLLIEGLAWLYLYLMKTEGL